MSPNQPAELQQAVRHLLAGRYRHAASTAERLVQRNQRDANAQSLLGAAYLNLGMYAECRRASEAAVRLRPKDPRPRHQIGLTHLHEGRFDDLDRTLERAFRECGPDPLLVALKAERLETAGDFEGAFEVCRPLLEAGSDDAGVLVAAARACARTGRYKRAIEMLRGRMESPGLPPVTRCSMFYTLAEAMEAAGDHDAAFLAAKAANDLKEPAPSPAAVSEAIDRYIEAWGREAVAAMPRAAASDLPVFIVGFWRSGTTLVEQTLDSHPEAFGAGELTHIVRFAHDRHDPAVPLAEPLIPSPEGLTRATIDRFSRNYLSHLRRLAPKAARVCDKLPINFVHLGLISALFPGARVIHCTRNPIDTCISCYFNLQGGVAYAHDLGALGSFYRDSARLMAHWKSVLDLRMIEVRYEDLVSDHAGQARRVVDFVGLPWDEACLRPHENQRIAMTRSVHQVRKPVYGTSVARWKRYERHLGPLIEALGDAAPGAA